MSARRVCVTAPSRLHMGLLNESASFGRVDGGIGLAVSSPAWVIEATRGESEIKGVRLPLEHQNAIGWALQRLYPIIGSDVQVVVHQAVPPHAGLGAKTSLLLGLGRAVTALADCELSAFELASLLGRGGTSGVGINTFAKGGFVWDIGHRYPSVKHRFGPSSEVLSAIPPKALLCTPIDWLSVVHFRFAESGLSGPAEVSMFRESCPTPVNDTVEAVLCTALQIVPALLERDGAALQAGIARLQDVGLKRVEWQAQSPATTGFRGYWKKAGMPESVGLSSAGPTLFILTETPEEVVRAIDGYCIEPTDLCITIVDNIGATTKGVIDCGEEGTKNLPVFSRN